MDEEHKIRKPVNPKKSSKKSRKGSDNDVQKKFKLLMNTGGDLEYEMRVMNSKLRKINKDCNKKKKIVVRPILKGPNYTRKNKKVKQKVAFDLKNTEYIYE